MRIQSAVAFLILLGAWIRCGAAGAELNQLEPLPPLDLATAPIVPVADFTDESTWLQRWQQSHEDRAAADVTGIVTDRPSFTYSSAVVPKGWVQVESGYLYTTRSNYPSHTIHAAPELTLRVGVTRRLEFRAVWAGVSILADGQFAPFDHSQTQSANLQVGTKFQVSQNRGWIPQSALVTTLFLPTGDGWTLPAPSNLPNRSQHVSPLIDYVYTWSLTDRWSLGGSTGGVFDGEDGFTLTEWFQSVILRYQWTPRLSLFFEGYALFGHQETQVSPFFYGGFFDSGGLSSSGFTFTQNYTAPYLDAGVLWRPWRNVQFDWRAGLGLNNDTDNFFTGCGLSFRY